MTPGKSESKVPSFVYFEYIQGTVSNHGAATGKYADYFSI